MTQTSDEEAAAQVNRYGQRYEYKSEDGTTYLLTGIDKNSVLQKFLLSKRFKPEKGKYGFWRWCFQNISALWVFVLFWWKVFKEKSRTPKKYKELLNSCTPPWYPTHEMAQQIRRCVTGTGALVPIYDREAIFPQIQHLTAKEKAFLHEYGQPEALDVTNRLFSATEAQKKHIDELVRAGQMEIVMGSIASGSSRTSLDAAYLTNLERVVEGLPAVKFIFHFVDTNSEALRSARDSARFRGFSDDVVFTHHMRASQFFAYCEEHGLKLDILEEVGLIDYLKNRDRIRNFRGCLGILKAGGIFVTAHINRTVWGFSVKYRTGWPGLRRRRPADLRKHLVKAGAKSSNITLETMPACGAHTVAVVRNN